MLRFALNYRVRLGFDRSKVALSVGVQPMVRSDLAFAGVIFTLDTESGFFSVVQITSSNGPGERVFHYIVSPVERTVFKPTLLKVHKAIIKRRLGKNKFSPDKSG